MKTTKLIFSIIAIFAFSLFVGADTLNPLVYQYTNPDVTVEFSEPLDVSAERQQEIADELAGRAQNGFANMGESPNNIICVLFGHDIAPQATVTVTHHKVKTYTPRCLLELYHVTYCKRCDYTVEELHNSLYVICCPED